LPIKANQWCSQPKLVSEVTVEFFLQGFAKLRMGRIELNSSSCSSREKRFQPLGVYYQNRTHKTAPIKTARTKPCWSKPRTQNHADLNRVDHNRAGHISMYKITGKYSASIQLLFKQSFFLTIPLPFKQHSFHQPNFYLSNILFINQTSI